MTSFIVMVDFQLKPGARPAFRELIDANARASVGREAACRRFDVIEPEGRPDCVLVYEIYDDRSAFDHHLTAPHYLTFEAAGGMLCTGKTVTIGTLVCEGGARP